MYKKHFLAIAISFALIASLGTLGACAKKTTIDQGTGTETNVQNTPSKTAACLSDAGAKKMH